MNQNRSVGSDMIFPCTQCDETGVISSMDKPYNKECPYCEGKGSISWNDLAKKKYPISEEKD